MAWQSSDLNPMEMVWGELDLMKLIGRMAKLSSKQKGGDSEESKL